MRAILLRLAVPLLLMQAAGCGNKSGSMIEVQINVDAPGAASVLVDGFKISGSGGLLTHTYGSLGAAMGAAGTVESDNADGSLRATTAWSFGNFCSAVTPLERETQRFAERAAGTATGYALALTEIDCVRTDGTGTIVTP